MNDRLLKELEVKAYLAGDITTASLCVELQQLDYVRDYAADLRAALTNATEERDRLRAKVAHLEATIPSMAEDRSRLTARITRLEAIIEALKAEVRKLAEIKDIISR